MGISIGLTRLFYVLGEQGLLNPGLPTAPADVLVVPMEEDLSFAIEVATKLRDNGIRTQLYTEQKKFKAKLQYANKLGIPFTVCIGDMERERRSICPKNMMTGTMLAMPSEGPGNLDEAIEFIKSGLAERETGAVILG